MSESKQKTLLLVEDEAIIAMAEARYLEREGYRVYHAPSGEEAISLVKSGTVNIDLILMDMDLGERMRGTDAAVEILKEYDIPVVFLSSHTEKNVVNEIEAITSYGYVIKDTNFTILSASIKMALKLFEAYKQMRKVNDELIRSETLLRQSESAVKNKLKAIVEPDGDIVSLDLADIIDMEAVQAMINELYALNGIGITIADVKGNFLVQNGWQDICTKFHRVNPETRAFCLESDQDLASGLSKGQFKTHRCHNGLWDTVTPIVIGDRHMGNLFLGQFFFEGEIPPIQEFRDQAKKYGFDEKEYLEAVARVPRYSRATVESAMRFFAKFAEMLSSLSYGSIKLSRALGESRRAETEREKLQSQLVQAQKMESVGRLAGGVAHDYNNMLSVIIGYTELALSEVTDTDPVYTDLTEILGAARRSADITRQLLAFARKQNIAPEVIDLNEMIEGMLKMLRWLIGEDITLEWHSGSGLAPIKVDPSQIDQILANLCVNARDAIEGVGTISIETSMIDLDDAWCADHPGFVSGRYVQLSVTDDGCGMEKDIQDKIFEPFFTTKELGQGTGLGLATVYGIVKQNSGFISVQSEPGAGTTFRIFLPPHLGPAHPARSGTADAAPQSRGETILLVEDEQALLVMTRLMLERLGYRVLACEQARGAINIAETHDGPIDLLLTDVIMPEMNGRDLADRLKARFPGMKNLFMSGYTAGAIANRGVMEKDLTFIQKPFSQLDLAIKVRKALDAKS